MKIVILHFSKDNFSSLYFLVLIKKALAILKFEVYTFRFSNLLYIWELTQK